jgi:hypothetical protein
MILKFLKNKKGGSTASIDYLLNKKRVQNGTAKILQGSEKHTRDIINSITKKQKVTFGVLSFEEKDIPEQQKKELMNEFEKTFFAGMKKEQYNILWVQHTDKDRLELNFVIPKVELSTGKSFNPYYHKTDFHLAELFQTKMNLKYNYTDPKDPAKQSSIQGNKKALGIFKGYRNLDKKLKELVRDGVLQSRDDIIQVLKNNDIEITDIKSDKIEVKLKDSKKPRYLKGGIYTDEFRSIDELRDVSQEQAQREREFASRDSEVEYRKVSERLERAVSKRASFYAEAYREPRKRGRTATRDKQTLIAEDRKREALQQKSVRENSRGVQEAAKRNQEDKEPQFVADSKREVDEFRRYAQRRAGERETILEDIRTRAGEADRGLFVEAKRNMQQRANRRRRRGRHRAAIDRVRRNVVTLEQAAAGVANFYGELFKVFKGAVAGVAAAIDKRLRPQTADEQLQSIYKQLKEHFGYHGELEEQSIYRVLDSYDIKSLLEEFKRYELLKNKELLQQQEELRKQLFFESLHKESQKPQQKKKPQQEQGFFPMM